MKLAEFISLKEYKTLLAVALLWFAIVGLCFCSEFIITYNESVARQQKELAILAGIKPGPSFSICGIYTPNLPIHLASLFIFISLLLKRSIISFLTTACYFVFFVKALIERFDNFANEDFAAKTTVINKIELAANGLDVFALLILPILLFWQLSIILRVVTKSSGKNILP